MDSYVIPDAAPLLKRKAKGLHSGKINSGYTFRLGVNEITSTDQAIDLGFLLDANWTLNAHCEQMANKAMAVVHISSEALPQKICSRQSLRDVS